MLDTEFHQTQLSSKLEVAIGVSVDPNPDAAIAEAAGDPGRLCDGRVRIRVDAHADRHFELRAQLRLRELGIKHGQR